MSCQTCFATITFHVSENACWICTKPKPNSAGYPTTMVNGKSTTTHRYIYQTIFGPVAPDLVIRHKCDEKRCINPAHLEIGTAQDNVNDRVERGRSAIGSRNGKAKLREEQVKFIKYHMIDRPDSYIASLFSVDRKTIRDIRQEKTWQHV